MEGIVRIVEIWDPDLIFGADLVEHGGGHAPSWIPYLVQNVDCLFVVSTKT